ncbi:MAG: hypothetical protein Q8P93_00125 [bacterium]|nr:hypothetical protein [bacterium]
MLEIILTSEEIEAALNNPRLRVGVEKYLDLQQGLQVGDCFNNEAFRKSFKSFYKVRFLQEVGVNELFRLLKEQRQKEKDLREILMCMYEATGQLHKSFSSKIVATCNPDMPVIDSKVLQRIKEDGRRVVIPSTVEGIVEFYEKMKIAYKDFLDTKKHDLVARFCNKFPEESKEISEIKMLDFVLWQA